MEQTRRYAYNGDSNRRDQSVDHTHRPFLQRRSCGPWPNQVADPGAKTKPFEQLVEDQSSKGRVEPGRLRP